MSATISERSPARRSNDVPGRLEKVRVAASKIYSDLEQKKITHEEASRRLVELKERPYR
jgi:hypothetical protein